MQTLHANTTNSLAGVMPRPVPMQAGNPYQQGAEQEQQRLDAQSDKEQSRKIAVLQQMAADPANAAQIAKMYGMPFDANMQALFNNKATAQLAVKAVTTAKDLDIRNSTTASAFIKAYVAHNGDLLAATTAVEGMTMDKPDYTSVGGRGVFDKSSGKFIPAPWGAQGGGAAGAGGNKLPPGVSVPKGQQPKFDPASGAFTGFEHIPGVSMEDYGGQWFNDPRIPASIRGQAQSLVHDPMAAVDPAASRKAWDDLRAAADPYLQSSPSLQSPALQGVQMPSAGGAPAAPAGSPFRSIYMNPAPDPLQDNGDEAYKLAPNQ